MVLEDLLHPYRHFYRKSPRWCKRSVGQIYALLPMCVRYGRALAKARRFLGESQWWSWDEHRAYQWREMKALLEHAYAHVPYYRRVLEEAGIRPEDIRSQGDWHRLPLLTKDIIREEQEALVAENMRNRKLSANTGGSTGRPLQLYWERGRTRSLDRAFMWRQWEWAGFRYGERTAMLRGQTVRERLWHYDPIDRHLFVDAYSLSDENMPRIVEKLREFRPVSIQAYPSNLTILAGWMKHEGEPPIEGLKVVLCGSENLYEAQKRLFDEVFQARVYSWYGHAESVCLAGFCEQQDYYHAYTEYGYTELVDAQGNPVPWEEGAEGEIVGTGFINRTMPFIRYRTGDFGVVGPAECTCGRKYPLLVRIPGRRQEYIITADGRPIALTGLIFGQHWHAFARIRQVQLVQTERGRLTVRIVPGPGFRREEDEQEIREKMQTCVKSGLEVDFEYVDAIALTARGKHIFIKQSLPPPSKWAGEVGW